MKIVTEDSTRNTEVVATIKVEEEEDGRDINVNVMPGDEIPVFFRVESGKIQVYINRVNSELFHVGDEDYPTIKYF